MEIHRDDEVSEKEERRAKSDKDFVDYGKSLSLAWGLVSASLVPKIRGISLKMSVDDELFSQWYLRRSNPSPCRRKLPMPRVGKLDGGR